MASLLYLVFVLLSRTSFEGILNPRTTLQCFRNMMHPENGKSILVVQISKVEGQTVDFVIRDENSLLPTPHESDYHFYKNLTTSKDVYIAIDNRNEGCYAACFRIIPKKGQTAKENHVKVRIIRDQPEVNQIMNKIFDAGAK